MMMMMMSHGVGEREGWMDGWMGGFGVIPSALIF
jgi:hypothetical protein